MKCNCTNRINVHLLVLIVTYLQLSIHVHPCLELIVITLVMMLIFLCRVKFNICLTNSFMIIQYTYSKY